jgi:hypothetical protein
MKRVNGVIKEKVKGNDLTIKGGYLFLRKALHQINLWYA